MAVDSGRTFAFLALGGLGGYAACIARHWCQCGHMEHPPYAWWDYGVDVLWVTLFAAAALAAVVRWGAGGLTWSLLLGALIASRFALPHTMGLSVFCFELPVSVALLIHSVWLIVASFRAKLPPVEEYE